MMLLLHREDFQVTDWVKVIDSDSPKFLFVGEVIECSDGHFKVDFKDGEKEWFKYNKISRTYEPPEDKYEDVGTTNWWLVEK